MPLSRFLAAAALVCAPVSADVTLRYKTELKMNPALPQQMTEQAMKSMATAMPGDTAYQWKDGKGISAIGKVKTIVDVAKGQLTLIDPENKRITTATPAEFMEQMTKGIGELPEQARAALAAMKVTTESKATGRTETIRGVQSEEQEVTMSMEGPPMPNAPPGPMMKMSLQLWTAKAAEVLRIPALRELTGYNIWSFATMNPVSSLEKMFQQMPGMGEGMGKFLKDMQAAKPVVLRSRVQIYMPAMAAAMKQMTGADFDASVPFMEMTQEVSELSDAPIPASVFAVPADYKTVSVAELVKEMIPKPPAPAKK